MSRPKQSWLVSGLAVLAVLCVRAERVRAADPTQDGGIGTVVATQGAVTLTFISETEWLEADMAQKIQSTFFKTYPQECEWFNSSCASEVTIRIKPTTIKCGTVDAPGCTLGTEIQIAGDWLWYYMEDYDIVTHEAMHVVQNDYVDMAACGYWIEGVADLARAWFGVNNDAQGWRLFQGDYSASYQQTAHFLDWISTNYGTQVIVDLEASFSQVGCPSDELWIAETGFGIDALVNAYNTGTLPELPVDTTSSDPT